MSSIGPLTVVHSLLFIVLAWIWNSKDVVNLALKVMFFLLAIWNVFEMFKLSGYIVKVGQ